jgi:hypothetical protein
VISWPHIELLLNTINSAAPEVGIVSDTWRECILNQYKKNLNQLYNITKIFSVYTMRGMWKGLAIPYNDLPLYINNNWQGLRAIVLWRLKIGR